MAFSEEQVDEYAINLVDSHLREGVEYLTVSEYLTDEDEDTEDEDVDNVYARVNAVLHEMRGEL